MCKYFYDNICIFKRGIAQVVENNGPGAQICEPNKLSLGSSLYSVLHSTMSLFKWIILLGSVLSSMRLKYNMPIWKGNNKD